MPALTSEHVVLGLAGMLTLIGLIGLAPSFLNLVRRRRLLSQLAHLEMEEEATETLFGPVMTAPIDEPGPQPASQVEVPDSITRTESMFRTPNVAAVVVAPAPPLHTVPVNAPATVTEEEEDEMVDTGQEDSPTAEQPEDGDEIEAQSEQHEAADDEDDLLSLFRETKITSSTPAILAEAIEKVTAGDLLKQARELRDMLRSAP